MDAELSAKLDYISDTLYTISNDVIALENQLAEIYQVFQDIKFCLLVILAAVSFGLGLWIAYKFVRAIRLLIAGY